MTRRSRPRGNAMRRGHRVGLGLRPAFAGWALLAALVFTSAISHEAAAAAIPPPPRCNPCASPADGSAFLSAQGSLFDAATYFQTRLGAQMSYRDGTSANPQGGGAESPTDRYRTWFEGYG